MSVLSLRLPDSLHHAAKEFAEKEHVSINHLITLAVAEKLSSIATANYLCERAEKGSREKYLETLAQSPDVPPESKDIL